MVTTVPTAATTGASASAGEVAGDRSAGLNDFQTREQRIESHLPLVSYTVNRMTGLLTSGVMEREDAISHGIDGLISAVDNFDPDKGCTFSTYAVTRIRGAILDAARAMDFVPRAQRQRIRELEKVTWEMATALGRWPTAKELSLKASLPVKEVKQLQAMRGSMQSLDRVMSGRDEDWDWQPEDPDESVDPEAMIDRQGVSSLLSDAMLSLQARDRQIIDLYYNHGLPFRAIGERLNISESRVSQLHNRIISRLRSHMEASAVA